MYFLAVYVVVQFQFVNSFLSLFYIAFYLQDMQLLKDVSFVVGTIETIILLVRRYILVARCAVEPVLLSRPY